MNWVVNNVDSIVANLIAHLALSVPPILLSFVLSVPFGWFANRFRWSRGTLLTALGVLYAIPSLAMFILLPAVLGLLKSKAFAGRVRADRIVAGGSDEPVTSRRQLHDRENGGVRWARRVGRHPIVFGLLGGAVLATVLVLLTLRRFSRRRRFSRALMVPVWLVVLAVAALAGLVVPTTGWQGWLLLGSMAASVVFVMVGCLAALGPGVSEWLRESRRGHPPGS